MSPISQDNLLLAFVEDKDLGEVPVPLYTDYLSNWLRVEIVKGVRLPLSPYACKSRSCMEKKKSRHLFLEPALNIIMWIAVSFFPSLLASPIDAIFFP